MSNPSFFGRGLAFPMQLVTNGTKPLVSEDEEIILDSMDQIINTDVTERPFIVRNGVPFGTRIRRVLFDSAAVAIDVIKYEVRRALGVWEPRIIVDNVDAVELVQPDTSVEIVATVAFRFRSTNRADNFVTPFRFTRPQ